MPLEALPRVFLPGTQSLAVFQTGALLCDQRTAGLERRLPPTDLWASARLTAATLQPRINASKRNPKRKP